MNSKIGCQTINMFTADERNLIRVTMRIERGVIRKSFIERGIIRKKLRLEQNLVAGLIAGVIVGIIVAVVWCAITVATEFQIGYMAIAVGAGVGFAIRYFGKGVDQIFGICGAAIASVSCILGNYFSVIAFIANMNSEAYTEVLFMVNPGFVFEVMKENFSVVDLLFYGFAAFEGYKFSFRNIDEERLSEENV